MKNAGKTVIIVNGDNNTVNIGEPKSRRPVVLAIIICVVIVASALIVSHCCPESYSWEYQPKGYLLLPEKIEWLKSNGLWNDLLDYYIEKKNNNLNPDKHSRAIFAESIAEMCQKNGYHN